ncbi:cardiolipin synthase [Porphyromonas pogonae]|uniref:cardiolipin synthase n=1 Tax=Porphyromonas pogonae TaxID=867595 RepID=UPI002E7952E7|nr:cardiolipin synthase [Porphyromonas pogonae]
MFFSSLSPWFLALYVITVLGLIGVVLSENRNPLKASAWVLVIGFVPFLGLIIYLLFGQDQRRNHIINKRVYRRLMIKPQIASTVEIPKLNKVESVSSYWQKLIDLIKYNSEFPVLLADNIRIYSWGTEMFTDLFKDIENAHSHIHIESYIFEDDELTKRLSDVLIRKVQEGVRVRIIFDHVGSWHVPNNYWRYLKKNGIQVYPFMPVAFPFFTSSVNYRNHRKIIVIDGIIGYVGGMNIAQRYISGNKMGVWRDSHFRISGPAIAAMQTTFLIDWYVVSRKVVSVDKSYPEKWQLPIEETNTIKMQFIPGGPVAEWRSIAQVITNAIARAKKRIYIETPYFLPTESLNNAIITAALAGVDVQLIIPKNSDTPVAQVASNSYFARLLTAGVKINLYEAGFLHSKLLMVDGEISSIGSANMDFRSLEHNFEFNAIVYDKEFTRRMEEVFLQDLSHCHTLSQEEWLGRCWIHRAKESLGRIFSPLL